MDIYKRLMELLSFTRTLYSDSSESANFRLYLILTLLCTYATWKQFNSLGSCQVLKNLTWIIDDPLDWWSSLQEKWVSKNKALVKG